MFLVIAVRVVNPDQKSFFTVFHIGEGT